MNQINSKNEINQTVRQQNKKCNHILSCQLQQVYTRKFLKLLRTVFTFFQRVCTFTMINFLIIQILPKHFSNSKHGKVFKKCHNNSSFYLKIIKCEQFLLIKSLIMSNTNVLVPSWVTTQTQL